MSAADGQVGRTCCSCLKSDAALLESSILTLYSLNIQDIATVPPISVPEALPLLLMLMVMMLKIYEDELYG